MVKIAIENVRKDRWRVIGPSWTQEGGTDEMFIFIRGLRWMARSLDQSNNVEFLGTKETLRYFAVAI